MEKENIDEIMADCEKLLEHCREFDKELKAEKEGLDFLLNEYRTNKRWFRDEPGRVTTEDIIKRCFEFGWASKSNFDYMNGKQD